MFNEKFNKHFELMPNRTYSTEVDSFLRALSHPLEKEIQSMREEMLKTDSAILELYKWNAPSYQFNGVDFATIKVLPVGSKIQIVLHKGVQKTNEVLKIRDPQKLLKWKSSDRAIIEITPASNLDTMKKQISELVVQWISTIQ